MPTVTIQKVAESAQPPPPIFEGMAPKLDEVRDRAVHFFEERGMSPRHDLEDWLRAEKELLGGLADFTEIPEAYEMQVPLVGFQAA